uniref:HicB family protein n=1 Tax=Candidatus Kentrum sp. FM TaxID=2126340 RepID=A0A450TP58_9GAMM|nr:MAG: hypothetical protein BECKFM1743C_GA0114222_105286 [Candidatus Kentron sp. FM]VFJ74555.1 MAG: hypothetical protein BECKFM1743A_GA0114220_107853 [Candidatus Kentron sp. FM]VFK21313.1 MAG: hypothetical protein BECKFM1743B_GA0114221_107763 [Candidatus Kentron sp. FM]
MTHMAHYALQVPEPLFAHACKVAEEEKISANEFFVAAIAEKISSLETRAYFRERGARGDILGFDAWLSASPDIPVTVEGDRRD